MDLQAASHAASKTTAQLDAGIKTRLPLKHGMTEAEAIDLVEALKRSGNMIRGLPHGLSVPVLKADHGDPRRALYHDAYPQRVDVYLVSRIWIRERWQ
jgi:hypothetical protein